MEGGASQRESEYQVQASARPAPGPPLSPQGELLLLTSFVCIIRPAPLLSAAAMKMAC